MTRSPLRPGLPIACIALLLAAGRPAYAMESVRIGVPAADNPLFIPFRAGVSLGIFAKHGIEATVTNFRGGGAEQEAMAAGAVDIMHITPPVVALARKKGVKEQCVFALGGAEGWQIIVPAASPVTSMKDLANGKVAITSKGSTTDLYVLWAMKQADIKAQTIPLGGTPTMLSALKSKQIDATILWPTFSYKVLLSGEARSIVDLGKEMKPAPSCIVADQHLIEERPALLKAFLEGVSETILYLQAHEDVAVAEIRKVSGEEDPKVLEATFTNVIKTMNPQGTQTPDGIRNAMDLASLAGLAEDAPTEGLYTNAFLPAAR